MHRVPDFEQDIRRLSSQEQQTTYAVKSLDETLVLEFKQNDFIQLISNLNPEYQIQDAEKEFVIREDQFGPKFKLATTEDRKCSLSSQVMLPFMFSCKA